VAFPYVNANDEAGGRFVFDQVQRGAITSSIEATGTVEAVETVDVGSEVSGLIAKVFVNFNDLVSAGQPIAELDRAGFEARVAEARAAVKIARALADVQRSALRRAEIGIETARADKKTAEAQGKSAEVRRAEAEKELQRKLRLAGTGAATDRELSQAQTARDMSEAELRAALAEVETKADAIDMAQADAEMARANIANAEAAGEEKEAALDEAEVALGRTIVRAPIDGVVISREVNPGQAVAAGLETKTLFRIAHDLAEMQVHGSIDEADIGLVREGQRVDFTVDAYPGRVFKGRVAQVRKAPATVQNVVTYAAIVFQQPALLERASALENVALPLVYAGAPATERRHRAEAALDRAGLRSRAQHFPWQLSGGEQQRVSIARAIVNDPALILADEPTGALDSQSAEDILALFDDLNRDGRTLCVVTHAREVAERARRVILLRDGAAVEDFSPRPQARL
jgi:HlyD family secretion protein